MTEAIEMQHITEDEEMEMELVDESEEEPLSNELQHGLRILTELMAESNKSLNWPFMDPVDTEKLGLYDYHDRIKKPMWIKRMKEKFDNREYASITEFVGDMRLMLENCYRYNGPDHYISKRGQKLETVMEQKLALLPREIREKTAAVPGSSFSTRDSVLTAGTSTRRRKILHGHDTSALLNQLRQEEKEREREERRQTILERQKERKAVLQELQDWEDSLFPGLLQQQKKACWEIAQIGHFIFLCSLPLNIGEVMQYELEHCFMMPRESSTMQRVMTALLSTPYQRTRLDKKPMMPYGVWENKLRTRLRFWYKIHKENNKETKKTMQKLGLEEKFFKVCGHKNPLEKRKFHELSFYQRVWIVKGLCDWCLETQESIQQAIEVQPIEEQREYLLGFDADGYSYIHFPQFCGADLRIYRQKPLRMSQTDRSLHNEKQDGRLASTKKKQLHPSSRKRKKETKSKPSPVTPRLRDSRLRQNPRQIKNEESVGLKSESIEADEIDDEESDMEEPPIKSLGVKRLGKSQSCQEAETTMVEASQSGRCHENTPTRTLENSVPDLCKVSSNSPSNEVTDGQNIERNCALLQEDSKRRSPIDDIVRSIGSIQESESTVSTPLMCLPQSCEQSPESGSSADVSVSSVTVKVLPKPGANTSRKLDFDKGGKSDFCEVDNNFVSFNEASKESPMAKSTCNELHKIQSTKCLNSTGTEFLGNGDISDPYMGTGVSKEMEQVQHSPLDHRSVSPAPHEEFIAESTVASQPNLKVLLNCRARSPGPNCDMSVLPDDNSSICVAKPSETIVKNESCVNSPCSVDLPFETIQGQVQCKNGKCEPSQDQVPSDSSKCDIIEKAGTSEVNSCHMTSDKPGHSGVSLFDVKRETADEGFGEELSDDDCQMDIKDMDGEMTGCENQETSQTVCNQGDVLNKTVKNEMLQVKLEPCGSEEGDHKAVKNEAADVMLESVYESVSNDEKKVDEDKSSVKIVNPEMPGTFQPVSEPLDKSVTVKGNVLEKTCDVDAAKPSMECAELLTDNEESSDEELEEMGPEIGDFELIADSVELLKKLVVQFAEQEPIIVETGKKQRVITPPPRKRCVTDLHGRLEFLLKELEPWESKLAAAHRKARMKMRKEQENYKEEPEPKDDIWESEESMSESSSEEESEEEKKGEDVGSTVKVNQKFGKKATPKPIAEEDKDKICEEDLLGISSRGRIRKRRIIPNNIEDQGIKKRKLTKENEQSPSPTPNILQRNRGASSNSASAGKIANVPPGISLLNSAGQTLYVNTSGSSNSLLVAADPKENIKLNNLTILTQLSDQGLPATVYATKSEHVGRAVSLVSSVKLATTSNTSTSKTSSQIFKSSTSPAMIHALLQENAAQARSVNPSMTNVRPVGLQKGVNLTDVSKNIRSASTTVSVEGKTVLSRPGISTNPNPRVYNYKNVSQLPADSIQKLLQAQGLKVKAAGGRTGVAAGSAPGTVFIPGTAVNPAGVTLLTNLIQSGMVLQAVQGGKPQAEKVSVQSNTHPTPGVGAAAHTLNVSNLSLQEKTKSSENPKKKKVPTATLR